MKYAIQFYDGSKKIHDTNPMSKEEAFTLFNECLDEVKRMLKGTPGWYEPVLCIWEDVGDGEYPNYHKELVSLDMRDGLKLDSRDNIYYETKVYVSKLPTQQQDK